MVQQCQPVLDHALTDLELIVVGFQPFGQPVTLTLDNAQLVADFLDREVPRCRQVDEVGLLLVQASKFSPELFVQEPSALLTLGQRLVHQTAKPVSEADFEVEPSVGVDHGCLNGVTF